MISCDQYKAPMNDDGPVVAAFTYNPTRKLPDALSSLLHQRLPKRRYLYLEFWKRADINGGVPLYYLRRSGHLYRHTDCHDRRNVEHDVPDHFYPGQFGKVQINHTVQ